MPTAYENLRTAGVAVWLDDLNRERLGSGSPVVAAYIVNTMPEATLQAVAGYRDHILDTITGRL